MRRISEPSAGELELRREYANLYSEGYRFFYGCDKELVPELVAACARRGFEAVVGEKLFSADGIHRPEKRAIFGREKNFISNRRLEVTNRA
jgi:hypothetical protein